MRAVLTGLILSQVFSLIVAVCVLESEFGFILNCNFKKSGLFRVRNLGGLKAHFGLGFSFGDELGFQESLGNLEGNRRRALNYKTGFANKVGSASPKIDTPVKRQSELNSVRSFSHSQNHNHQQKQNLSSMTEVMFLPLGVPTFRPIPTVASSNIRRSDMLLPTGTTASTFSEMLQNQDNETDTFPTNDMINSFTHKEAINDALKNITLNMEDKPSSPNRQTKIVQQSDSSNKVSQQRTKGTSTQVMNAPKEYYPSGYDKNFDDNFRSKVNLPANDFTCSEQKYFPGLYANIDLGCMVFHVCAITEDGIVMKSFLCPESTLFDQSILKCNWWFYVDCNNSTYDSNIPVAKSYQLMKSLSYLSNITKN
ncbi:uncharacterized protein LOC129914756 [Episyrphus balteatus]|uniref:uncharacterized protein LOC129914756 n=1 Tax=Episyrphus balteatus TaxID=286459 RepID=UPI0024854807|nr:uncharacterized protein LOC129914756 [Episyrphus balteatus]